MFTTLPLIALIPVFLISGYAIWIAGTHLSSATDAIDNHFGLGEAVGGLVFLSFATNLPEIAIVISAALAHQVGIAVGNILGGIAMQTLVLVVLDGAGLGRVASLSNKASSPQIVLEGLLVIAVLVITIMGTQLPASFIYSRLAPADFLILLTWFIGLALVSKARSGLPWKQAKPSAPAHKPTDKSYHRAGLIFIASSIITLIGGFLLERTGSAIAAHIGWSGVLFGSTVLAAVTALPEISTGLAAMKLHDYTLAYSDIFGGNAFLPTLFLPATLISGQAVLPFAESTDIYLASLGALLTAIYICGLIFKSKRQCLGLGLDSIAVLIVYTLGMIGLFKITGS